MWLRLAVVAVALLTSFGVRARDFDISGNEYIGNIIREFHVGVLVAECRKSKKNGNDECIYRVNNSEGLRISVNANTGRIYFVDLFCIYDTCRLAELVEILMKTSPMLSKYAAGWNDSESWEYLINKKRTTSEEINRRNMDLSLNISTYTNSDGNRKISVFIFVPIIE